MQAGDADAAKVRCHMTFLSLTLNRSYITAKLLLKAKRQLRYVAPLLQIIAFVCD